MTLPHLCWLASVSVSGYYAWKHRAPGCRQFDDMILLVHIRDRFFCARVKAMAVRAYMRN